MYFDLFADVKDLEFSRVEDFIEDVCFCCLFLRPSKHVVDFRDNESYVVFLCCLLLIKYSRYENLLFWKKKTKLLKNYLKALL
jgi:hypothetical protein